MRGKAGFLKLYFPAGEIEGSDLLPQTTDYQQKYILDKYDQEIYIKNMKSGG